MADLLGFDASQHEEPGFEALPAGDYVVMVRASEKKPTKKGDGEYLKVEIVVLEGPHKGRTLFDNFNLRNPSAQAQGIGQAQLASLCRAVNVIKPRDSLDLHNIPCIAKVACKKRDDTGEMGNEIRGYKPTGNAPLPTVAKPPEAVAPWVTSAAKTTQSA